MSPWHCIITPWANWVAFLRSHEARGRNWIKKADLDKRAVMVEKIEIDWPRGGPTDAINSHSDSLVTRTKAICVQSNTHTAYGWERETDGGIRLMRDWERYRADRVSPERSPIHFRKLVLSKGLLQKKKNNNYWAVLLHHHVVIDIPSSPQHSYKVLWSIFC